MKWLCPQCRRRFDPPGDSCPDDGTSLVEDRSGQSVGGCVLEALIGVGRRGSTVWEAARGDEPRVAVKVLPVDGEARRESLQAAARTAAAVRHSHLVSIHGHGSTVDGHVYIVMDLLEGVSLAERLIRAEPMPVEASIAIIGQVLEALSAAHREGLPHLELEPAHVFVRETPDGPQVTVLDVGLAQPEVPDPPLGVPPEPSPPEVLLYRAPEQFVTGQGDAASDLYAVGALLVHLLTGRPPYSGSHSDLRRAHLSRRSPRLAERGVELPRLDAAQAVVDRLMAKQPGDRYPSAAEARLAVGGLLVAAPPSAVDEQGFLDEMEDSFQNLVQAPAGGLDAGPILPPPPIAEPWSPAPPPTPAPVADPQSPTRWPLFAAIGLVIAVGAYIVLSPSATIPLAPDSATVARVSDQGAAPPRPSASADAAPPADAARAPDATPVDATPADAAPVAQLNRITSTPGEASIRLADGNLLGKTPWSGILPADVRRLEVTLEGYEPQTLELSADEARSGGWTRAIELTADEPAADPEAVKRWKARQAARRRAEAESQAAARAIAERLAAEQVAREAAAANAEQEAAAKAAAAKAAQAAADKPTASGILPLGRPARDKDDRTGKTRVQKLGEAPATGAGTKAGGGKVDLLGDE